MKSLKKNFLVIGGFLALVVLFFSPYLLSGKIPYVGDFTGSDLTELNLPLRFLASQSWQSGQVPLWTNLLANGFAIVAEGQAGVFYPFNLILFPFLPFGLAVNLSLVINFFLAGLFIYIYCRFLKISRFGSIFAAVAFSFSGFFVFRLKHLNLVNAAIWLPLIFYLIEKYFVSKRKSLILIALSFVFTIQFFAGHPQILYISLISAVFYFYLKAIFVFNFKINYLITKLIWPWIIIGLILFGLAAIQLLPTLFYSASSGRSLAMSYTDITGFPFLPANILYFVAPYFLGNPAFGTYPFDTHIFGIFWENNIYFGLSALLLALVAIFSLVAKKKEVRFLVILFLFSGLFILGDSNPIFIILWQLLPGLQMFRFPQRFFLLALFCLTVLAGFGFDFIFEKINQWFLKTGRIIKSKILFNTLLPLTLILILAVDLFVVSFNYLGALDYGKYFSPSQSAQFLQQDPDKFRIYSFDWPNTWSSIYQVSGGWQNNLSLFNSGRELIPPNLNVFWNLASAQDRASLEGGMLPKAAQQLGNRLMLETWLGKNNNGNKIIVSDQALKIFGLENVKYFLSFKELDNQNLILAKEIKNDFLPPLKIYQNKYFLPFAFGVFKTKSILADDQAMNYLFDPNFDPAQEIVLAAAKADLPSTVEKPQGQVKIIKQLGNQIVFQVNFSQPGYLFVSQNFVPGWQAKIDNQPTKIIRANQVFSAVLVPAGNYQITFAFEPIAYLIGKWLTLITLASIFVFGLYAFFRKKSVI
ncbi:MAG: YfhO family protein [Patescibacteria group bacterium]